MKITHTLIVCFLTFLFVSCKKEQKKETKKEQIPAKKTTQFSLKTAKNSINFIAYKATEKIPVAGKLKKIELINNYEGNTIKEAIDKAEFKIPISSLETADSGRNFTIRKFFFGAMENTLSITGKLILQDDNKGIAKITMNNITQEIPFDYVLNKNTFSVKTTINIEKWNTQKAINSLNKACKALHKGSDGISKTWSEVAIEINTTF